MINLTELERIARDAISERSYLSEGYVYEPKQTPDGSLKVTIKPSQIMVEANPDTILALISALKTALWALDSIASLHNPDHSKESYWLKKASHESCADCLSRDTVTAREALATISSVCEWNKEKQ